MERPATREFKGDPVNGAREPRRIHRRGPDRLPRLHRRREARQGQEAGVVRRLVGHRAQRPHLARKGRRLRLDGVARAEDPERAELDEMLSAWAELLGVGRPYRYTLAEVRQSKSLPKANRRG